MTSDCEKSVSPVVGVVLVLGVTVVLAAIVGTFVLNLSDPLSGESVGEVGVTVYESNGSVTAKVITGEADTLRILAGSSVLKEVDNVSVGDRIHVTAPPSSTVSVVAVVSGNTRVVARERVGPYNSTSMVLSTSWDTASDWDSATSESHVEHSSSLGSGSVRLGALEDDGDTSEYYENMTSGASHTSQNSTIRIGPYARKIVTENTADSRYDHTIYTHPSTISPGNTTFWVRIPKPDTDDWIFKPTFYVPDGSGGYNIVTSVGFDAGSNTSNVISLKSSGGWNNRGDYPANTWFQVRFDWHWSSDSYDLYVNGTHRGTESFRASSSGYIRHRENWDYRYGGITGYVDHVSPPYPSNGTIVTNGKTISKTLDASTISLTNTSSTLNGGSATVYVESDPDGDGTFEEVSDPITLNGTSPYSVTGLTSNSDTFRLRVVLESDSSQRNTPVIHGLGLQGSTP